MKNEVSRNVHTEPSLIPGGRIDTSANTSNKEWLDISATDFYILLQNIDKMFQMNEKEKNRMYKEHMSQIDNGLISLMLLAANGLIG